jgi:hypothetical protein
MTPEAVPVMTRFVTVAFCPVALVKMRLGKMLAAVVLVAMK